jgi:hypothetical protein
VSRAAWRGTLRHAINITFCLFDVTRDVTLGQSLKVAGEAHGTSDMSERNGQLGKAHGQETAAPPLAPLRYLARTSPPIPDEKMQEAHRLIEADSGKAQH